MLLSLASLLLAPQFVPVPVLESGGDLDANGVRDVLIADRWEGVVWGLSGTDGTPILRLASNRPEFGQSLASVGDLSGDGHDDVIVAAQAAAIVYSGRDGSVLRELKAPSTGGIHGIVVGGGGDVDGDGTPDFIIGDREYEPGGRAYLFSGAKWQLLRTFAGTSQGSVSWKPGEAVPVLPLEEGVSVELGMSATLLPDLNADGLADVALGCAMEWHEPVPVLTDRGEWDLGWSQEQHGWTGYVEVISVPRDTALLHLASRQSDHYEFGWRVASPGDADADGKSDVLVASTFSNAWLFSGDTAEPIYSVPYSGGEGMDGEAQSLSVLGDLDGDQIDDFAVGGHDEPTAADAPGFVEVHSPGQRKRLWRWETEPGPNGDGAEVCAAGDVNGDSVADFAVYWVQRRSVRMISGADFSLLYEVRVSGLERTWGASREK